MFQVVYGGRGITFQKFNVFSQKNNKRKWKTSILLIFLKKLNVCSSSFIYFLIIRWNTEFFWIWFETNFDFKLFHVAEHCYLPTEIICSFDGFWYLIKLYVDESNNFRSRWRTAAICSFDRFLHVIKISVKEYSISLGNSHREYSLKTTVPKL